MFKLGHYVWASWTGLSSSPKRTPTKLSNAKLYSLQIKSFNGVNGNAKKDFLCDKAKALYKTNHEPPFQSYRPIRFSRGRNLSSLGGEYELPTAFQSIAAAICGRRIGSAPDNAPNPGDGLIVAEGASAKIFDTIFSSNAAAGIRNTTGLATRVTLFKVATYFNGTDVVGSVTISPDPNYSNE